MRDKNGDTLLHMAVQVKDLKVIKYLVANGADYNIKNSLNQTPVDLVNILSGFKRKKYRSRSEKTEQSIGIILAQESYEKERYKL